MRFIHSADWQLGARFSQFGAQAAPLRAARLTTLQSTLALADRTHADAFLIAGDLFEDNQIDESLITAVLDLFRAHPALPIFILPGNHDPHTGPDSVWQRMAFLHPPPHVHVLREATVIQLTHHAHLLAAPLHQKQSSTDPSLKLAELAASLPSEVIKIGITHGALAIESKHQPNDFPIALHAASRAGLDYLAVGHWHNWLDPIDGGRMVMPGTPEPDRFGHDDSGHVALVEIDAPGQIPRVQKIPVATLLWRTLVFDFFDSVASRASIATALAELAPSAPRTVLRVTLTGTASPATLADARSWLAPALAPFLVGQLRDESMVALSAPELADLQTRHPILAQVLADIDRLETFALGTSSLPPATTSTITPTLVSPNPLTLAEAQALLAPSRINLTDLKADFFPQLRQTILQHLQEVGS